MVSLLISPREGGLLVQLMVSLLGVLVTLSCIHLMGKCMSHGQGWSFFKHFSLGYCMETIIRGFQSRTDCGNWLLLQFLIPVVLQNLNADICCINHYPVDYATVYSKSYPVDSTHQIFNDSAPASQ